MCKISFNGTTIDNVGLVIFDKDGTLMDLFHYWSSMVAFRVDLAWEKLGFDISEKKNIMFAMGVDIQKGCLRPEGPVGLKKREVVLQSMIDALMEIGFSDVDNLCFDIFKEIDFLSVDRLEDIIRPINGMDDLLSELKKKGCKNAIATTDKTERAVLAMKFLGVENQMDMIVGADLVSKGKPDPEMAFMIFDNLKINKKNAVMVGDAITDVQMGINAGCSASIGVLSGLTGREVLTNYTPHIISDISEIMVSL